MIDFISIFFDSVNSGYICVHSSPYLNNFSYRLVVCRAVRRCYLWKIKLKFTTLIPQLFIYNKAQK